jgi:uncharacterized protein with ParB-like and HNH nuclease domain/predicted transport protein
MKANEEILLKFLQKANHFIVPIYQRTYSWTEKQCEQLWKDVIRAGQNQHKGLHFVGSVVYIQDGIAGVMNSSWQIIDGQQRLTTVTLLLEALASKVGDEEPLDGFSKTKIRNRYLLNPEETGDRHFKLSLTDTDNNTLRAIISQKEKLSWPSNQSIRITANYEYFLKRLETADIETVCRGLSKLAIVDVSLERGADNPQLIFESMNSTGKELSQADLIRNFILMDLNPALQGELYNEHWRPMEIAFGQEAYADDFDNFMRYYLTVRTGSAPKKDDVYEVFKAFTVGNYPLEENVRELVKDIHVYADFFCRISYDKESHPKLKMAFNDLIGDLGYSVTIPTLLKLFKFFDEGSLSDTDFVAAVRLIESYVFRRAIVGIPTSSMNKTFAALPKDIDPHAILDSLKARLLLLQTYRRFPTNEEFARAIMGRDMYNMASRSYWLRRLENVGREKELVNVEEYSIEHILPQNPNLSSDWTNDLGDNWKDIQQRYLHTIGNLTLTGYNPEYSDLSFLKKRDMKDKGLRFSPLNLNQGFAEIETWDAEAIEARAKKLSSMAVEAWPSLEVDDVVLAKYRPKNIEKVTDYSLEDHEYLHNEDLRALFEQLNEEILLLDPNVSSEVLKLYIAYRLETNFVDIVPQKSRLRLSLNMKFHDLDDPLGLCKDVTNIGRWGNGDVEIGVKTQDEIPYVLGLIRQSLERQLN